MPRTDRPRKFVVALVTASSAAMLASGCGGGGGAKAGATASTPKHFVARAFNPLDFGSPTPAANKWLPLNPGTQWVRVGTTDVGHRTVPHRVVTTVTDVTKQIDGVRTVAVLDQDIDAGQVTQQSLDYFAQDKRHNIWNMGGYTEEYEGGRFVSIRDAWLGGVKGGRPGIFMQGDPKFTTPPWTIAQPPGADPDAAQIVKTGESQCVPFKCFKQVLIVREGKASALDNEFKYYAAGVGEILNTPKSASQHKDVEKLVNLTTLSPRGRAEIAVEALKLDKHAQSTKPDVFSAANAAKRGL